jgi:hypothetical protein
VSTVCAGVHVSPDIWVVMATDQRMTGFQMLTERAKKWALSYKEMDDPETVNSMLWVPQHVGSGILQDLATDTALHILLDTLEGEFHA